MRKIFTSLLILISIQLFAQKEKRLALVIGNANYEKGVLKNPVNDARLIATTLDSLDFDVILKENLTTKREMTAAIREFGNKRSEYDVAFVYYAGHGIQVDGENYLLPTKEIILEEFDVLDYGVSVQNIMRYLGSQTSDVNILILDACRDNPFESNWNKTRSLKSQGLAKIPPPTGSLIAFSTNAGQTSPDGDGENSVYTISLSKNMLLDDTSIDQVFRNVRSEVLTQTNGIQRPVEATQLTGQAFYLRPGTFENDFIEIDNLLLKSEDLTEVIEMASAIISKQPENHKAFAKRGHAYAIMKNYDLAISDYKKSIEIYPKSYEAYQYYIQGKQAISYLGLISIYDEQDNFGEYEKYLNELYKIGEDNPYYYRQTSYMNNRDFQNFTPQDDGKTYDDTVLEQINIFKLIDDNTISSYSKVHSLNYKGHDQVFLMKNLAAERLINFKLNDDNLSEEFLKNIAIECEELLKINEVNFINQPWSYNAIWYHLKNVYERLVVYDISYEQKYIDGLYSSLKYDDISLKIESFTLLSDLLLRKLSFEKSLSYGLESIEMFDNKALTSFLFEYYISNTYYAYLKNLFNIHEDYINVIKYVEKYLNLISNHHNEDSFFSKGPEGEIILNKSLCNKLDEITLSASTVIYYFSYLSGKMLEAENSRNEEEFLKVVNLLEYNKKIHGDNYEIYKFDVENKKLVQEIKVIKGEGGHFYKLNHVFFDNFIDSYANVKKINAPKLNDDIEIARKIYNVIRNMALNDAVDFEYDEEDLVEK